MTARSSHVLMLSTCPDRACADQIARTLVEEGLAACINVLDGISSYYRWQGKLENEQESLLLIKTTHETGKLLEKRLVSLHPYELPEIISVPIQAGFAPYLDWITKNTGVKT